MYLTCVICIWKWIRSKFRSDLCGLKKEKKEKLRNRNQSACGTAPTNQDDFALESGSLFFLLPQPAVNPQSTRFQPTPAPYVSIRVNLHWNPVKSPTRHQPAINPPSTRFQPTSKLFEVIRIHLRWRLNRFQTAPDPHTCLSVSTRMSLHGNRRAFLAQPAPGSPTPMNMNSLLSDPQSTRFQLTSKFKLIRINSYWKSIRFQPAPGPAVSIRMNLHGHWRSFNPRLAHGR